MDRGTWVDIDRVYLLETENTLLADAAGGALISHPNRRLPLTSYLGRHNLACCIPPAEVV
jgi:hypothetical protein